MTAPSRADRYAAYAAEVADASAIAHEDTIDIVTIGGTRAATAAAMRRVTQAEAAAHQRAQERNQL